MDRGAFLHRAQEAKKCGLQSLSDRESSILDLKNQVVAESHDAHHVIMEVNSE